MTTRNHNIDILKALAIFSVILLHSLPEPVLFLFGAPYHIWQSVPIFLILAGYNTANSYKKRNYESLSQFYNFPFLYNKLKRLVFPFLLVFIAEAVANFIFFGLSAKQLIMSFVSGGWGPGSYFVPIIIQATLITPIIYMLCRKNLTVMTIGLFIVNLILEAVSMAVEMPEGLYRLLVIRYLFAITLGVWLALNGKKINYKWIMPLSVFSLIYITGVNYFDWVFITEEYWLSQHAPSYFWPLLLIIMGLRVYEFKAQNKLSKLFVKIGQASYHIFLVQMVYFWSNSMILPKTSLAVYVVISLIICLVFGLLFFEMENFVRKAMAKRKEDSEVTV